MVNSTLNLHQKTEDYNRAIAELKIDDPSEEKQKEIIGRLIEKALVNNIKDSGGKS